MNRTKANTAAPKNPWSIKGVKPNNREAARQIAGENGMTIGEWINNLIEGADVKSDSQTPKQPSRSNLAKKRKAETLSDIYKQYGQMPNKNNLGNNPAEPQNDDSFVDDDLSQNNYNNNGNKEMSQSNTAQFGYNEAEDPKFSSNETSKLALAMEALNRKLEAVTQPPAYLASQNINPAINHNFNAMQHSAMNPVMNNGFVAAPQMMAQPSPVAPQMAPQPAPQLVASPVEYPRDSRSNERAIDNLIRKFEDSEDRILRKNERLSDTINDLKDAQNSLNEKLRKLEKGEGDQRFIGSLRKLEDSIEGALGRIGETSERTEKLERDFVTDKNNRMTPADVERILEGSVNTIHSTLEKQFGKFNERLGAVEEMSGKTIESAEKGISLLKDRVNSIEEHAQNSGETMRQALVELSARLTNLEADGGKEVKEELETRITATVNRLNEIENNIAGLYERTKAEAEQQYTGFAKMLSDKIEQNEQGTLEAIENMSGQLVKTAESFDGRIRDIEQINEDAKETGMAMRLELGKISNMFDSRLNEIEKGNSNVIENVEEHLDKIAQQMNNRLNAFEQRNKDLEEKIKNHALSLVDERIEEAHKDIYDLVRKNGEEADRKLSERLNGFDTRLNVAQETAQSITKPLHETLSELVGRLETFDNRNHFQDAYKEKSSPATYSYDMVDNAKSHDDDLDGDNYETDLKLIDDNFDDDVVASSHIDEAVNNKPDAFAAFDNNVSMAIPAENMISSHDVFASDFNKPAKDEYETSAHEEENPFDLDLEPEGEINFIDNDIDAQSYLDDGSHDELAGFDKLTDGKNDDSFNENLLDLDEDFAIEQPKPEHKKKTYIFDEAELNNVNLADENTLSKSNDLGLDDGVETKTDYLKNARMAAIAAANASQEAKNKSGKKSQGQKLQPKKEAKAKAKTKAGLEFSQENKANGAAENKPLISPIGVAIAGALVVSGAYAGYSYLQNQKPSNNATAPQATTSQAAAPIAVAQKPAQFIPDATEATEEPENLEVAPAATNNIPAQKQTTNAVNNAKVVKPNAPKAAVNPAKPVARNAAKATAPTPAIVSAKPQVNLKTPYGQALAQEQGGNLKVAADLYEKAAAAGDVRAMNKLSKMFERGQGVPKDLAKAKTYTEKAAASGSRLAQHNLGVYYADGEGGVRDYSKAADNFKKAANRGMTDSQYNLGAMAEKGLGMDKNPKDAYYWYSLAAKNGDKDAKARANDLGSKLNSKDKIDVDGKIKSFHAAKGGNE